MALLGAIGMSVVTPLLWWYGSKAQRETIRRLESSVDASGLVPGVDGGERKWIRVEGKLSVTSGKEGPIEFQGQRWYSMEVERAILPVLVGDTLVLIKDGIPRTATTKRTLKTELLLGTYYVVHPSLFGTFEYARHDPMYSSFYYADAAHLSAKEYAKRLEDGIVRRGIPLDDRTWTVYTYSDLGDGTLQMHNPWTVVAPLSHKDTLSKHRNNMLITHAVLGLVTLSSAAASYILWQRRQLQ